MFHSINKYNLGDGHRLGLRELLLYCFGRTDAVIQSLFWGLLFWLSSAIYTCGIVVTASDHPLQARDLVCVKGRSLKISNAKKAKVARIASRGDVFGPAASVIKDMDILAGGSADQDSRGSQHNAKKWVMHYCRQFIHMMQQTFSLVVNYLIPIYSISCDATRLSGRDTLIATIWAAGLKIAGWFPPQAAIPPCSVCIYVCNFLLWS